MFPRAVVFFFCGVILLLLFLPGYAKLQDLRQKNFELEQKIAQLKLEQRKLLEERVKIQNDPVYVEKLMREKMGIVRKGEIVYKIEGREQDK